MCSPLASGWRWSRKHPLAQLSGANAKAKVLAVLLDAHEPLNPSAIQDRASIHHDSWYRVPDELVDTGLVEVDQIGNSPRYAVTDPEDDQRVEWLRLTRDWTSAVQYHDHEPPTSGVTGE